MTTLPSADSSHLPPGAPDVVLVHGYDGSGPQHWQTWLRDQLVSAARQVQFPQFPDNTNPDLDAWLETLEGALAVPTPTSGRVVICHSLGCWLWVHAVRRGLGDALTRVLLVAPPSPSWVSGTLRRFSALNWDNFAAAITPTTDVVIGEGDDLLPGPDHQSLVDRIPSTREVARGGHLHTAAGYGPWPAALAWALGDPRALYRETDQPAAR